MREQTVFVCEDGSKFETPEEAQAHEATLEHAASIDAFIVQSGAKGRRHGEYKRVILGWEAWKSAR